MPHAWLIGGPPGIGKATLAYRLARFVLAHPDPRAAAVQTRDIARRRSRASGRAPHRRAGARRSAGARARASTSRPASSTPTSASTTCAASVSFFGSTAGEGGWRIAIVDAVDELAARRRQRAAEGAGGAAGARAAAAGQPCAGPRAADHPLALPPPAAAAAATATTSRRRSPRRPGATPTTRSIAQAAAAADGSVARALALLDGPALALRQQVARRCSAQLPNPDPRALHALGDALGGTDPQTLATFMDLVNGWLSQRLGRGDGNAARAWRASPRPGRRSTAPRATSKPTISSASRSCSRSLPNSRPSDAA